MKPGSSADSGAAPRLLILGSCVSRDILDFPDQGSIELAGYFARSSIASIASDPCDLEESDYARIASDFQRRMVRQDLAKTFIRNAARYQDVDFILIDLVDERFDLYEMAPGSIVTISSEFMATGVVTSSDRASRHWIRSGDARHRELWKAGVKRLFAILAEHGLDDRIVVNKVFWADRLEDGTPLPELDAAQREAANGLLAWMYRELEQFVPAARWMTFTENAMRGSRAHRWGIAPFHYSDAYYAHAVVQLKKLDTARRHDGAVLLEDGKLLAWAGRTAHPVYRACFLVCRDRKLVHKQPYAVMREMVFDTGLQPGEYEVTVFTLSFAPTAGQEQSHHKKQSSFRFHIAYSRTSP